MVTEIVVRKKGQITIPVGIRKKLEIKAGTRLEVVLTDDSVFLKPKN